MPRNEFVKLLQAFFAHPEYLNTEWVKSAYGPYASKVISDPFGPAIVAPIKQALTERTPLSVVRIGDGEANLLTYGAYPDTPRLNRYVVERIIAMQEDRFTADAGWMRRLSTLMMGAVVEADVVGVIGLWRARPASPREYAERFLTDHRGISGQWRAVDFMVKLARQGVFDGKIVASAHLYFAILENLGELFRCTERVFVISNRRGVTDKLRAAYPEVDFRHIVVGESGDSPLPSTPAFFRTLHRALPDDMTGTLSLLGAGPWAEIYGTLIKRRGGVAVDVGSGFDLLDGRVSRPVHRRLDRDPLAAYTL